MSSSVDRSAGSSFSADPSSWRTHPLSDPLQTGLGFLPSATSDKDLQTSPSSLGPHLATDTCQTEPDLATVMDAWDRLPEAVRAGIVAMVKAAAK